MESSDKVVGWLLTQGWPGFVVLICLGAVVYRERQNRADLAAAKADVVAAQKDAQAVRDASQARVDAAQAQVLAAEARRTADALALAGEMKAMAQGNTATIASLTAALKES